MRGICFEGDTAIYRINLCPFEVLGDVFESDVAAVDLFGFGRRSQSVGYLCEGTSKGEVQTIEDHRKSNAVAMLTSHN